MLSLDSVPKWTKKILESASSELLFPEELATWNRLSDSDKKRYLKKLLTEPIVFEDPWIIYDWYFRSKWSEAFTVIHPGKTISVLEIGAGGNDLIPKAVAKTYPSPLSQYITANLNKELTNIFKAKTKNLPITVEVIEDDAQNIEKVFGTDAFDMVVFEHSANDVIETILADKNGIDTITSDWMEILPQITEIVNHQYQNGTLEQIVKTEFLHLISSCLKVLKPNGRIAINHYQFQYNLDIGLNPNWNENLLSIVRTWISEAKLGKEVFVKDFEPQWWMFLKK